MKNKKSGRRKLRPSVKFILCLTVCIALVLGFFVTVDRLSNGKGIYFIGKDLNVRTTHLPDYVKKDYIKKGKARTGEKLSSVENIVIHYTANPGTTAKNNRDYFAQKDTEVCSHFVVGIDGEIIQCLPINEKSAASNNRNIDTISVEVCHKDKSGKFSKEAYDSAVKLTAWLCKNSGLNFNDVIRHYDITGKDCPKYYVKNKDAWRQFKLDVKDKMLKTKIEIPKKEKDG